MRCPGRARTDPLVQPNPLVDQGELERLRQAPHYAAVALEVRLDPQRQRTMHPRHVAARFAWPWPQRRCRDSPESRRPVRHAMLPACQTQRAGAVFSGQSRPLGWAPAADLDYLGGAKLRGMQEVMGRMSRASLDFGGSSTTDHTIGHSGGQVGQAGTGRSRCACIPETVLTGLGHPPPWPAVMRCRR
jgi:hypothetical protein